MRTLGIKRGERAEYKRGAGCEKCSGTGYKGRTGLFELLAVDEPIQKMIADRASASVIKNYGLEAQHMTTLLTDGRRVVLEGLTTPEEVLRVCQREDVGLGDL